MDAHGNDRELDLDCGIAYARIESWLDVELGLPQANAWWSFSRDGKACLVHLERLEKRSFGTIDLERTRLIARGDAEALASFKKLFTLRFVSAGG